MGQGARDALCFETSMCESKTWKPRVQASGPALRGLSQRQKAETRKTEVKTRVLRPYGAQFSWEPRGPLQVTTVICKA